MSELIMRANMESIFPVIGVAGEDLRRGDLLMIIPDPGKEAERAKSGDFEEITEKEGNHTTETDSAK